MKKILLFTALLCLIAVQAFAITLPLPNEPPIQDDTVWITDGYSGVQWDPCVEADYDGTLVFFSIGSNPFTYDANRVVDVGIADQFLFTHPEFLPFWISGTRAAFGIAHYDTADNVSGIQALTDGGLEVAISFFGDAPLATPSGLSLF